MDEQGFDFKPVRKEPPKRFEPPPWEREAFEELKRSQEASGPEEPGSMQTEAEPEREADAGARSAEPPDEAQMLEMLALLAEDEPTEPQGLFAIGMGASLVLVAIGGVLIIWAMAALVGSARTGLMGQVSGTGLGLFGAFFLGTGAWMMYRTLRRRGVL